MSTNEAPDFMPSLNRDTLSQPSGVQPLLTPAQIGSRALETTTADIATTPQAETPANPYTDAISDAIAELLLKIPSGGEINIGRIFGLAFGNVTFPPEAFREFGKAVALNPYITHVQGPLYFLNPEPRAKEEVLPADTKGTALTPEKKLLKTYPSDRIVAAGDLIGDLLAAWRESGAPVTRRKPISSRGVHYKRGVDMSTSTDGQPEDTE